jgi:hypothetical protein
MSTVHELLATDDTFREVADLLFGGGGDQLISKMNPTQSDVSTKGGMSDRKKRQLTAGLSAVGAAAGGAGLALGGHNVRRSYRAARYGVEAGKKVKSGLKPVTSKKKALKTAIGHEKLATGLVPLEVAGLTGEIAATKILHGDTKKKSGNLVKKDLGEVLNNASAKAPTKRNATKAVLNPNTRRKGLEYTKKTGGTLRRLPDKVKTTNEVKKAAPTDQVEVVWEGEIAKADSEKQQLFGWASVIEVNGEPVVDLQGDYISADEMEKAAYSYVQKSRKGGDMHLRDEWEPIQKSEMIESFIVTPEKRDAMGLPDSVPTGWWVGFKVNDADVWSKVKSGERTGFSIHGKGRRTPA